MNETAEKFWKTRTEYPPVIYNSQRRYLDLGLILKHVDGANSILDIGCGEGHLLLMLRELTEIEIYIGYDLSQIFINNMKKRWGDCTKLQVRAMNFLETGKFQLADMCTCMGVMPYISDTGLKYMLSKIRSVWFICRAPCSMNNRIEVDKFSENYNDNYAAIYRTLPEYISILSDFFNIESIGRCYPDEIESKYGTKQFYFVCEKKE